MKAQPLQKGKGVAMKAKPCKKAAAKAKTSCKKPGGGLKKIHWQKAEQTKPGEIGSDDPAREIEKSW